MSFILFYHIKSSTFIVTFVSLSEDEIIFYNNVAMLLKTILCLFSRTIECVIYRRTFSTREARRSLYYCLSNERQFYVVVQLNISQTVRPVWVSTAELPVGKFVLPVKALSTIEFRCEKSSVSRAWITETCRMVVPAERYWRILSFISPNDTRRS